MPDKDKKHRWPKHEKRGPNHIPCRYEDRCLDCGALHRVTPRPPCQPKDAS